MRIGGSSVAVSRVHVEGDDALHRLHACEAALLGERATPRRLAEFAAGRSAARKALRGLLGLLDAEAAAITILPDTSRGRPRAHWLASGSPVDAWLSITHTAGLAAAAACAHPIGIDLVKPEALTAGFTSEAFCEGELEAWQGWFGTMDAESVAAIAFGAKEAALKLFGTGMGVPLLRLRVTPRHWLAGDSRRTWRQSLEVTLDLHCGVNRILRHRAETAVWRLRNYVLVLMQTEPGGRLDKTSVVQLRERCG